ncbi:uncharacterized protein LOC106525977 [Austrofundulus limnaeus]|uniref:Uncharacterized protein LOC106525977 n=1 Tax=Austrofundulus limnaeus TaxID=52670 RepID=A0A2I4C771_AUSLI|nr:PREDICTED: uncharacterized protein LOC106525977 [Austrofundulus limnaeus]
MAASVGRPPAAYSRPVGGNPGPHSSGLTSSVQPDLGPHCSGLDPGFSAHLHQPVFVPPAVYTHAPPPPFLHYQWPTPFPFPPFPGYPGFGMVLPTPPYLEAPAYLLPHPHIQPVDYRRLLPPQVPAQYPNPTHRTRLPYVPPKETANSEVQTEIAMGFLWPPDVSDSGHGTGSNPSHSPGSSSAGLDNRSTVQSFTGMYIGSGVSDGTNEDVANAKHEVLFKVLRLPQADTEVCLESCETVGPVDLPFCERPSLNYRENLECSENLSCMFLDGEPENSNGTNLHYDLPDMAPSKMSSSNCPAKQKLNESIWSVESLEPYIPSQEWLMENSLLEPGIQKPVQEARKDRLSAQSDKIVKVIKPSPAPPVFIMSVQMSEDGLDINVQDEQQSPPEPEQDQSSVQCEHDALSLPTPMPSEAVSPTEDENDESSSEPEAAAPSPNQEAPVEDELQEKGPSCQEEMLLQSLAEKLSFPGKLVCHTQMDGDPVTLQKITKMLPSKGHLMDFGVQCSKGQDPKCFCGMLTYRPNKNHVNTQTSGTVKLKLSGSVEMCRKGLVSGGGPLDGHTNQQEVHTTEQLI